MVLLYPFTFILLVIILWQLVFWKRKDHFLFIGLVFIYLMSTPLVANLGIKFLRNQIDNSYCDTVGSTAILLAGGVDRNANSTNEWLALNDTSIRRVVFLAKNLDKLAIDTLVISGGSGSTIKEAELILDLLGRLTSLKNITLVIDKDSRSTIGIGQNLEKLGVNKRFPAYLITSDWHMARAQLLLKQSVATCPLPSNYSYAPFSFPGWLIPQKSALVKFELFWHELGGLIQYYFMK